MLSWASLLLVCPSYILWSRRPGFSSLAWTTANGQMTTWNLRNTALVSTGELISPLEWMILSIQLLSVATPQLEVRTFSFGVNFNG
jgi:hypothetical protein